MIDESTLIEIASALGSPQRLALLKTLAHSATHVSQLARDVQLSRPLVHMHLKILERAGLVRGHAEISDDGKALKIFELTEFTITIDPKLIRQLPIQEITQPKRRKTNE